MQFYIQEWQGFNLFTDMGKNIVNLESARREETILRTAFICPVLSNRLFFLLIAGLSNKLFLKGIL